MKIQSVVVLIFTVFATQSFTASAPITEKFQCTPKITLYTYAGRCTCNDDGKSVTCLQKSQPHGAYSDNESKSREDRYKKRLNDLLLRIKILNKKVNNIDRQDKEAKRREGLKALNVSKTEMIQCTPKITVHTSEGICTCNDDGKNVTCPTKSHAHGSHSNHESEHKEDKLNEHHKKLRKELLRRIKIIQERIKYLKRAEEKDKRLSREENEKSFLKAAKQDPVEKYVLSITQDEKDLQNMEKFDFKPIEKFDIMTNEIMKEAHRYDIKPRIEPRIKPYEPRRIKVEPFDFHPMIHIL